MITEAQFRVSEQLAREYGHEWASYVSPDAWHEGLTSEEILEYVVQSGGDQSAICTMYMNNFGVHVHTTGSGRLMWEVFKDGAVTFSVYRPEGMIFCGGLDSDGDLWIGDHQGVLIEDSQQYLPMVFFDRHVESLAFAFASIGVEYEVVEELLAPLRKYSLGDAVGTATIAKSNLTIIYKKDYKPEGIHYVKWPTMYPEQLYVVIFGKERHIVNDEQLAALICKETNANKNFQQAIVEAYRRLKGGY